MRFGFAGSLISKRIPFPEQAPAASPIAEYTVMSWHWLVSDGLVIPSLLWVPALFNPLSAPVVGSIKIRGLDTTFASCGAARGTLITSMRNREVFGSFSGLSPEQPANSSPCRTKEVPDT